MTPAGQPGGVESLYPFLYSGSGDLTQVLVEVRRSTEEKASEVAALRESVVDDNRQRLLDCARALAARFAAGGRMFTFGNGGSSTDAAAVAHAFLVPEAPPTAQALPPAQAPPLPATSLTADAAVLTALSNDIGFDVVFARQIAAFATAADIALGLSTSGGSPNVLAGFEEAHRRGVLTVGFAGYDGGRMAETSAIDHLFVVPSSSVHRIQEAQTTLYHLLAELTGATLAAARAG